MLPFDLDETTAVQAYGAWAEELASLGVPAGREAPALAAGALDELPQLLRSSPSSLLIEGDARRALRRAGYEVRTVVALPDSRAPRLLLRPDQPAAAAYALRTRVTPRTKPKELRRDAAAWLLRRRLMPPVLPLVTIGYHGSDTPFLVSAAERELRVSDLDWFLVTGAGDPLTRGAYFLFRPGASVPEWVLKFARVRGYEEPFRREQAALHAAHAAADVVAAHAPTSTALLDVHGRAAAIQSVGAGRRLDAVLVGRTSESKKMALVTRILSWLLDVAASSRASRDHLDREWRRLEELAKPLSLPLPASPFFDPILVHNDLGGWNIVVDRHTFTAVDWESSRRYGPPLWDLWYFLVHALPLIAGVADADLDSYLRRLLRGEDQWSNLFFDWTRKAAAQAGIADEKLGLLAALCWLHHASSRHARAKVLERHVRDDFAPSLITERLPSLWLGDDGLGLEWRSLFR